MFPVNTTPNVVPEVLNYAPEQLNLFFCDILQSGLDSMRSSIIGFPTPDEPAPAGSGGDQTRHWLNQLGPERKNNGTTWLRVGQALHSEHGEMGLPLWIEWTTADSFPSSAHTAQNCREAFAKFRDTSLYSLGTIIKFATEDQKGGYWGANGVGYPDNQQLEVQNSEPARESVNEPARNANQNGNQAEPPQTQSPRHASVARRSPQGGLVDIIGPFTPMPDFYLDHVLGLLDSPETKVLFYMGRLVFGYFTKDQNGNMVPKLQDRIALSQLTDGRVTRDGKRLDHGTGLSERAVKKALRRLIDFGIVIKLQDNNSRNEGNLYALQVDFSKIDLEALANRKLEKEEKNRKRTESARQAQNKSLHPENVRSAKSEVAAADTQANSSESEVHPSTAHLATTPVPNMPFSPAPPAPVAPSPEAQAPAASLQAESKVAPITDHESSPASPAPTTNKAFDTTPSSSPAEKQEVEAPAREVPSVSSQNLPRGEETVTVLSVLPSLQAFNNGLEKPFNEFVLQEMNQMAIERHQMTDEEMHQLIINVNQFARIPPAFLYHTLIKGDATPPFVRTAQPAPVVVPAVNPPVVNPPAVNPIANSKSQVVVEPSIVPPVVFVHAPMTVDGATPKAPISDIAGILNALHTVNNETPADGYPLSGLEALARKLQARGETEDSVICAWQSCKQNGDRPLGAFITWVNQGFMPTTKSVDPRIRHWGAKNPNGGLISEYECARIPPTADQIDECMTFDRLRKEGKSQQEIEEEMGIEIW